MEGPHALVRLPLNFLVLLGIAYGCYVVTGVARVGELHLARAACESAQVEANRASCGPTPAAGRERLQDEATRACAQIKAASES